MKRLPHTLHDAEGRVLTLLDCGVGNHTGHFPVSVLRINGKRTTACDAHLPEKSA